MNGERDRGLRLAVLIVFLAGSVGLTAELLLLAHTDGVLMLIPLLLLVAGLGAAGWTLAARSRAAVLGLRWVALLQLLGGVAGLVLHYRSNVEFELEMQPGAGGTGLIWAALTGAIPALAPGAMIQLGLIGMLYTFAHPALSRASVSTLPESR